MTKNIKLRAIIVGSCVLLSMVGIMWALITFGNSRESRFKKEFSRLQGCKELRELSAALGEPLEVCSVNETNRLYQYYGYDAGRCGTLEGSHVAVYTFMSEKATYVFGMFTEEGCNSNIVKVIWVAM